MKYFEFYRFTALDYMISEWALIGDIGRTDHEFRFGANYTWLILDWALIRNIVTDRDTRLMVLIRNSVTNIIINYIDRANKKEIL